MNLLTSRLAPIKQPERTLSSGVLEHPDNPQYGKILYSIDIPLPQNVSEEVEKTILDIIQKEYFDVERKTAVYQFEDCVKQINAGLAELAEDGNSDWIGHVHAIIVLWIDQEIYVTFSGRALGVVVRENAVVAITDPQSSERRVLAHKTFANLVSGQLSKGDVILLGNAEINRHFSPQFLSQAAGTTPQKFIGLFIQAARRLNLRAVTIIAAQVADDSSHVGAYDYSDSIGQEDAVVLAGNKPKTPLLPQSQVLPAIKESSLALRKIIGEHGQTILGFIKKNIKSEKQDINFQDDDEPKSSAQPIQAPRMQRSSSLKLNQHMLDQYKHLHALANHSKKKLSHLSPRTILITGIVLLLVVTGSVWQRTHKSGHALVVSQEELNKTLASVRTSLAVVEENARTNPETARKALSQTKTLLAPIQSVKSADVESATSQYESFLEQINNTTTISTTNSQKVSANIDQFVVVGQYLFSFESNQTSVKRQVLGKSDDPVVVFTAPANTTITYLNIGQTDRQLIIGTSQKKLYELAADGSAKAVELTAPTGESWPVISSIGWYQNNIYVLEKNTGQIWKYISQNGIAFTGKQAYLSSANLADVNNEQITTDGNMYLINSKGVITKLLRGKPLNFGPLLIPEPNTPITNPHVLTTSDSGTSIFVVDDTSIIEISKDGRYVRQYTLNSGTIKDGFVNSKSKRAWVLVGDNLIETSL